MTTIETLFEEWLEACRAIHERKTITDEELDRLSDVERRVQDQLMATPATSIRDMMIKIVAADEFGDMCMSNGQIALAQEAWAFIGYPEIPKHVPLLT